MKKIPLFDKSQSIFFGNRTRTKVTANVLWQIADKAVRYGLGLIVGVWVTRYFGPDLFGKYSYAVAFVGFLSFLSTLGIDSIVTKDLVERPEQSAVILGTAFVLKLAGSLVLCFVAAVAAHFFKADDPVSRLMIFILSIGTVFQSITAIDFYYAARIQARSSIIAKIIPFLLISGVKVYLLLTEFSIVQLAILTSGELLLSSVFLISFYNKKESIRQWKASWKYCKNTILLSWPLIVSGFISSGYKLDQIMLGNMQGDTAVGIYAAAYKLSSIWYFLPAIMATSIYPVLIEHRKRGAIDLYHKRLHTLFRVMNSITIPASLVISISSPWIVQWLYGSAFEGSADILTLHIWTGVFTFLNVAAGNFYIIEGLQRLIVWRSLIGVALTVALNLLLIPIWSGVGTAVANLLVAFVVCYLFDMFNPKSKIIFKLKVKSLLFFIK